MAKFLHPFDPNQGHHLHHGVFMASIFGLQKVELFFFSKEDGEVLQRTCAPMDFGPSRRTKESSNRYHFWDYDSDTKVHTLSLLEEQIREIQATPIAFKPREFVTWDIAQSPWSTARDWAEFS